MGLDITGIICAKGGALGFGPYHALWGSLPMNLGQQPKKYCAKVRIFFHIYK